MSDARAIDSGISTFDVSHESEHAVRRRAELDADGIEGEAMDGSVVLRGTVRSWAEKHDARRARPRRISGFLHAMQGILRRHVARAIVR